MRTVIGPVLKSVEAISVQIGEFDKKIEAIATRYPEVELLTPIHGVGTLIALTFILTLDDAGRFEHSRDVGAFVGLVPKQNDSGDNQPEMGISKAGDRLLRKYLVQGAHGVMRKGAPDCDLRVWAMEKLEGSKGKKAKRRMVVGVARKLAVLMHRLWVTGEVYDPQYNRKASKKAVA
jgi:transposase